MGWFRALTGGEKALVLFVSSLAASLIIALAMMTSYFIHPPFARERDVADSALMHLPENDIEEIVTTNPHADTAVTVQAPESASEEVPDNADPPQSISKKPTETLDETPSLVQNTIQRVTTVVNDLLGS